VIAYNLKCADGHEFEGWFASSAAFDEQAATGKLLCPLCNSRKVEKAMMAPAVSGTKKPEFSAEDVKAVHQYMSGVRKYVLEHGEDVGKDFPEEARKIHYGETAQRPIYGEATLKEATELIEEGVKVAPLPPDVDKLAN